MLKKLLLIKHKNLNIFRNKINQLNMKINQKINQLNINLNINLKMSKNQDPKNNIMKNLDSCRNTVVKLKRLAALYAHKM